MPPRSHGSHDYVFQLYALDRATALPAGFRLAEAIAAMRGGVIARARLDGSYRVD